MEFAKGCDYAKYFQTVTTVVDNWDWDKIKGWSNWNPFRKGGLPATDYFATLLQGGAKEAAETSAKTEQKSLVYQLENICQQAVQMYETNRIHQIVQAGHLNIGNALDYIKTQFTTREMKDSALTKQEVDTVFANIYKNMIPEGQFPTDSLYVMMHNVLHNNLKHSTEMLDMLKTVQIQIDSAREQMIVYATREDVNGTMRWVCPDGYPDGEQQAANTPPPATKVVCGPASPERAQQIMTTVEILKTQLAAINEASNARLLEVSAIRLATINAERRQENWIAKRKNPLY